MTQWKWCLCVTLDDHRTLAIGSVRMRPAGISRSGFPLIGFHGFSDMNPGGINAVSIRRPIQDRRLTSRVTADLHCDFSIEGLIHEATITNLSLNGALMLSSFIPPERSHIVITLRSPLLKSPLAMESEVVRTESALRNGAEAFAVRFSHTSLDLIELIIKNLV